MYSWGGASNGELGLGGLEDAHVSAPACVTLPPGHQVVEMAPGGRHSLVLTNQGELYSCGSNDFGQLGREGSQTRLESVSGLSQYKVVTATSGANHSMAVDQWGSLFSWGSDESGQLGHNQGSSTLRVPRLVKSLGTMKVSAVSAGLYHSAAITAGGQLYTWGANAKGQLGLGTSTDMVFSPTLVESLAGVPLAGVACGGNHTMVVTVSGAVFAFGSNNHGQLGLGDVTDRRWPTQVSTMRNVKVAPRGLVAGLEHSVALTQDGGVFTWGSSRCGQLGHGNTGKETMPKKVMELMGTVVTQVAAGDRHTLAYVSSRAKLYAFGVGGSGQLGRGTELTQNASLPQIVSGLGEVEVARIAAGGNTSWCTGAPHPPTDMRTGDPAINLLSLSLITPLVETPEDDMLDQDMLEKLEVAFSSLACVNGSLLTPDHYYCRASNPGVDLEAWTALYKSVESSNRDSLSSLVLTGLLQAMDQLKENPPDMETLRFFLTFPLHPAFEDPSNCKEIHFVFAEKCLALKGAAWKVMEKWIISMPSSWLQRIVINYKNAAVPFLKLPNPSNQEIHYLQIILLFLRVLSRINSENGYPVSYETFYIPEVREAHNLPESYVRWLVDVQNGVDVSAGFYICNYPFMFDPSAKESILKTDQAFSQHQAQQNAVLQTIMSGQAQIPFLMLMVSRENIVGETIIQLQNSNTADLKKPLRVKFADEEAEDAGGVTKEFFMLLIKEILNPDYGMFKEYEESNAMWFNPMTFEDNSYYFLIGILYGLAIYNFTIINVPFPLVLYRKLLNDTLDYNLSDLAQLSPTTAKSLQQLLDYQESDVEDVFSLTFTISESSFGEIIDKPLKPNGENIPVTLENKAEYVKLYIQYVLNTSCDTQFDAFKKGFLKVMSKRVLQLFHPQELMALVVGNENYDWDDWQENCSYKEGYSSTHPTIVHFWEVFHDLSNDDKKRFLLFLTGSDRIPIAGMSSVKITIQKTADTDFLPVAHTCFNLLDLPEYADKETLQKKLIMAIQCTKGFGLV